MMADAHIDELRSMITRFSPEDWALRRSYGIVFLGNTDEETDEMRRVLKKWARRDGFPLKSPLDTVSSNVMVGRNGQLDLAMGGILLLNNFSRFGPDVLFDLRRRILNDRIPVTVIGLESLEHRGQEDPDHFNHRIRMLADSLGVAVVHALTMDDFDGIAADDVTTALAAINLHRRGMGMSPLDPVSSDWTDEDVLMELDRIERLPNPLLDFGRAPARMRRRNTPGVPIGKRGAKISAKKMLEMRYREDAARARKQKARKVEMNPERWLAPRLSIAQRRRLTQLHDVYFALFDQLESLPGAALTTPTGEYIVPEGYALLYRVDDTDYLFFQDDEPAETWSFIQVGRNGAHDRVEHVEDYLAVLERINDAVIRSISESDDRATSTRGRR